MRISAKLVMALSLLRVGGHVARPTVNYDYTVYRKLNRVEPQGYTADVIAKIANNSRGPWCKLMSWNWRLNCLSVAEAVKAMS